MTMDIKRPLFSLKAIGTILFLLLSLSALVGCGVNPVTGKSELQFISQQKEIELGKKNYLPLQQSQGGEYVIDPELRAYVSRVGQKVAAVADRKLPYEFVVINSSVPNAWALPGGKIGINRGLLIELESEAELAAVLGHEVVHAAARHSAKQMEKGTLFSAGLIILGATQSDKEYGKAVMGAGMVGTALLTQKHSRDAELEADHYGIRYMVKAGYDPHAAVKLQQTFVRLSEGKQANWLEGLFASHPPSPQRVEENRKYAKQLSRPGLFTGKAIYQKKIAGIKANKAAYKDFAEARKALKNKNYQQALSLADKAIAKERREGFFYALKGDIYQAKKDYPAAIKQYNKAVTQNQNLFYFYLQRGLTHKAAGNKTKARQDLEKSNRLLPTKLATDALRAL